MSDGLTVSGDRLEVTGSFGLTGAADLDSTLNVDGVADFKSAMYVAGAAGLSGSLDVAGAVDLASTLAVAGAADLNGALDVAGIADFQAAVYMAGDLGVSGSLTVAQAATLSNGLTVNGAAADFNADVTANKISIDSDVAERLYIVDADGSIKDESKLTFDGSTLAVDGDISATGDISAVSGSFSGDLTVAGDLVIQGSMTYIDTQNLKVQDALIHLNVAGNSNLSPRGIVLHGDQSYDDLALGAKPAAGDFIFAKEVDDADVDAGNSDIFAAAKLAAAWMNEIKLGGIEGSLSGSLLASEEGIRLVSAASKSLVVAAATDLTLSANNHEIGLMSSAEYSAFDTKFDATSVVGALNELFDMIGGGSAAKGDLSSANVAAGVLTFSSIGTLTAAEHKLVDVYLNGVLLSPSRDLSSLTTTTVTLDSGIASGLIADDVITVVIRSAA
jgi:cytoskeletal protein CcmA (bactofilin family)